MKAYSFTTRNVTAGERNEAGVMVLRTVGDVTVTLEGMLPAELGDWEWAAAGLNTRGWNEAQFLLTVRGWKVMHGGEVVGVLLQGAGTRVHVEWYDAVNGDFFSAAWTGNLRQGAAQVVNARQTAGQGLPVDVEPEPVKAPESVRPVWLEDRTVVRYHGSLEQISGGIFRVHECAKFDECDRWDCEGYALVPIDGYRPCALHVGIGHVTALDAEPAAA
ncbi:MAG: hypothetical protein HOY79_33830 [Streptomyces sp.]|nr:hypothetical protein [Streptomyces sp.]NUS11327.1 hypothetical protein [Streptomyces sp.]NUS23398.1 hypothetical protein [Streptomyces sp.]